MTVRDTQALKPSWRSLPVVIRLMAEIQGLRIAAGYLDYFVLFDHVSLHFHVRHPEINIFLISKGLNSYSTQVGASGQQWHLFYNCAI